MANRSERGSGREGAPSTHDPGVAAGAGGSGHRIVDRRRFLLTSLAGALAAPLAADAGKVYRVGVLSPEVPPPGFLDAFREGLRDFGHVDGQNISLELRDARGVNERLPDLARELVALNVDVIVAINTPAARAAKGATATIPIVMNRVADPVKAGLVSSLGRPGGNLTGLSFSAVEVAPKQLQLLKEMLPRTLRIGLLWYGGNAAATVGIDGMESTATRMSLQSLRFPVQHPAILGRHSRRRPEAESRRLSSLKTFGLRSTGMRLRCSRPHTPYRWCRSTRTLLRRAVSSPMALALLPSIAERHTM